MIKSAHANRAISNPITAVTNFFNKYSTAVLLLPYAFLFILFIVIPVIAAMGLSFTFFDTVQMPRFIGLQNYIDIFTADPDFFRYVVPTTLLFMIVAGLGGYILSFFLAWTIAQLPKVPRMILAIIIYSPTLMGPVMVQQFWRTFFNADHSGWFNYWLLRFNIIDVPQAWVQGEHLLTITIIVTLVSSMGVGFLAMLAGILNVNHELYEAAYIDGVSNRFQEIIYVTIPTARPLMLFGAVMSIVSTVNASSMGVALFGRNPTPNNVAQMVLPHIEDFGFLRMEMGYAAALSVVLLVFMRVISLGAQKMFSDKD